MSDETTDRLTAFLILVQTANWRNVPSVWNEQLRNALSDHFVSFGLGGVLKLTKAGQIRLDSALK